MILGVTCSTQCALLAGVEGGQIVETPVNRIEVGAIHEASDDLESTLEEIGRALAQIRPSLVVLLLPEPSKHFKSTHSQLAPRITLETLVRLAAVRAQISVDVMTRKTVRSRLKLDFSGDLASHVAERFPTPVAPYWKAGRDVAALAALAGELG
jgi:hypothetical protein